MSIFVIELDNCEAYEDRIVGVGGNAFKSYLDASVSLLKEGYTPYLVDRALGGDPDYEIEFIVEYEDEIEVARILELNLVETV